MNEQHLDDGLPALPGVLHLKDVPLSQLLRRVRISKPSVILRAHVCRHRRRGDLLYYT